MKQLILLLIKSYLLHQSVKFIFSVEVPVHQLVAGPSCDEILVVELRAWGWVDAGVVQVAVTLELVQGFENQLAMLG